MIRDIQPTRYLTRFTRELRQQRASAAIGPMRIDFSALVTDGRGRASVPVWHLHALRWDDR